MVETLTTLREAKLLSMLDEQVARGLARLVSEERPEVILAAAVASRATRQGHVCFDLRHAATFATDEEGTAHATFPATEAWRAMLANSELVGPPDDATKPLVLTGHRLYLRRYFSYEKRLAENLEARIAASVDGLDAKVLRDGLGRLFPRAAGAEQDLQRLAALVAVARRFCIITGGPGTGKTTTVVKMLALLQEQALAAKKRPLHIMLVAPTGKAAFRLKESILKARDGLACSARVKELIPSDATTIHRRLGSIPGSATRFRHDADNPLPCDVLLVDEASMVDLPMMTRVVEALPLHARLILLGDRNQLASVETGAILGDLCGDATSPMFSARFAARLKELGGEDVPLRAGTGDGPGIADCVVQLQKSWRYGEGSGIEKLALCINAGDDEGAAEIIGGGAYGDIALHDAIAAKDLGATLRAESVAGYGAYLGAGSPIDAAGAFGNYRVLCAHRDGTYGVEALGPLLEKALADKGLLKIDGPWYARRPVLVKENDYAVKLFNGDVGIVFPDAADPRKRRVHFVTADGEDRPLAPSRLPAHETAFAMTVHKSQGSEFDAVAVVLPDTATKVLTRDLLYTAVTRARKRVSIFGSIDVFRMAVTRPIVRASGLHDRLWAKA